MKVELSKLHPAGPRRRSSAIYAHALHAYHIDGLPCKNWKQRYISKANGVPVPDKDCYVSIPPSLFGETIAQADKAMSQFLQTHVRRLKMAYMQRMLAMKRSAEDISLVVYVCKVPGPGNQYRPISIAEYSSRDSQKIVSLLCSAAADSCLLHHLLG